MDQNAPVFGPGMYFHVRYSSTCVITGRDAQGQFAFAIRHKRAFFRKVMPSL